MPYNKIVVDNNFICSQILSFTGKIKENRIDRSVNRIIEIKEKYDISDKQNFEGVNIEEINEKIINIRKKCNIENT